MKKLLYCLLIVAAYAANMRTRSLDDFRLYVKQLSFSSCSCEQKKRLLDLYNALTLVGERKLADYALKEASDGLNISDIQKSIIDELEGYIMKLEELLQQEYSENEALKHTVSLLRKEAQACFCHMASAAEGETEDESNHATS